VAIIADNYSFDGVVFVEEGTTYGGDAESGQKGTAYTLHGDHLVVGSGVVRVDGSNHYASITLTPGAELRVQGAVQVDSPISVTAGSEVYLDSGDALDQITLASQVHGTVVINSVLTWSGTSPTILGALRVNQTLTVESDLTVAADGLITHDHGVPTSALRVDGALSVNTGGAIDVSGKGFSPSNGFDILLFEETQNVGAGAGGSYGGAGGQSGAEETNPLYGDARSPNHLGSGGGWGKAARVGMAVVNWISWPLLWPTTV